MDAGFETIGNATLICHDRGPVLATDPWVVGSAYFGSWVLSHEVPEQQLEAVKACPYVWLSHGHPDHLSSESLELLRERKILLPDHAGGRIARDLRSQGFNVHTMKDRRWYTLSPRIRALSIADYNQDAVLLVDINGTLVVNLNDASDRGWAGFVRRTVREYPTSFLLALSGYGDAGMINMFDEEGRRIPPDAARRAPVGQKISRLVEGYGTKFFVPSARCTATSARTACGRTRTRRGCPTTRWASTRRARSSCLRSFVTTRSSSRSSASTRRSSR